MVKSRKTGKTFVLPWQDIVRMAVDAGVNTEGPVTPPKDEPERPIKVNL
jgi:hypothetical protein